MRKLKHKYKWHNRNSHLLELEREKRLRELYGRTWEYGFRGVQMRNHMGMMSHIGSQWTDKELKRIKDSMDLQTIGLQVRPIDLHHELPRCSLADKSALDKVSGTTNPDLKDSYHLSDGFEKGL